jgi:hypothetical protein
MENFTDLVYAEFLVDNSHFFIQKAMRGIPPAGVRAATVGSFPNIPSTRGWA